MKQIQNEPKGAGAPQAPPNKISHHGCRIIITEHPHRSGRWTYRATFEGKPVAIATKSFTSIASLVTHAKSTIEGLFTLFQTQEITLTLEHFDVEPMATPSERPFLVVVDGGLAIEETEPMLLRKAA